MPGVPPGAAICPGMSSPVHRPGGSACGPSPHIRTTDALPPEDPRVTSLRQLVCAVGNKVLEEQAARQRLALDVQQLRAELSQARAAIRGVSRR
jgi:hypothetical protein